MRRQREPRWKYSANASVNGLRRKMLGKRKRLRRRLAVRPRRPPRRPERKLPRHRQLSCKRASRALNSSWRVPKSPSMLSNRSKLKNVLSLQANLKRIPAPVRPSTNRPALHLACLHRANYQNAIKRQRLARLMHQSCSKSS